jgi:hypothetical protein
MAKADGAQQETNLSQAGLPPSYGLGIQQGMYNSGWPNMMNGSFYGNRFNSTGPSWMNQGGYGMQNPYQQMAQARGFSFFNPISSPNLFSGITNNSQTNSQTTPLGASLGWSSRG